MTTTNETKHTPGPRFWVVAGKMYVSASAAGAKRFAKSNGAIGALSSIKARLATQQEIADYGAQEPARRALADARRAEGEKRDRLNAVAPDLLAALKVLALDPIISDWLLNTDPKAFDQARAAIARAEGSAE